MLYVPNKKCTKCKVEQPLTNYHAHPKLKYHPRCKPCRAQDQREYYVANSDKFKAYKARARNETVEAHPAIRDQAEAFKDSIRAVLVHYMHEGVRSHNVTLAGKFKRAGYPELTVILDT